MQGLPDKLATQSGQNPVPAQVLHDRERENELQGGLILCKITLEMPGMWKPGFRNPSSMVFGICRAEERFGSGIGQGFVLVPPENHPTKMQRNIERK